MPYFRVMSTFHEEGKVADGTLKRYHKGEVFESDKKLDIIFPNKFQRVQMRKRKGKEVILDDEDEVDEEDVVNLSKKKSKKESPQGKDVTDKFKKAEGKGLRVFLMEEGYGVFSEDVIDPLNDEPFKDEDDVKLFIKDYGKAKDEDEDEDETEEGEEIEEPDEEKEPRKKKVKKKKKKS